MANSNCPDTQDNQLKDAKCRIPQTIVSSPRGIAKKKKIQNKCSKNARNKVYITSVKEPNITILSLEVNFLKKVVRPLLRKIPLPQTQTHS